MIIKFKAELNRNINDKILYATVATGATLTSEGTLLTGDPQEDKRKQITYYLTINENKVSKFEEIVGFKVGE